MRHRHAKQQAIRDEANRKRSEATKAQPRTEGGEFEATGSGTISPTTGDKKHVTREAKAAASGTNRGAVERMDRPTPPPRMPQDSR